MSKTDVAVICAFYIIFIFAIGGFAWHEQHTQQVWIKKKLIMM